MPPEEPLLLNRVSDREERGPAAADVAAERDRRLLHAERARGEALLSVGRTGIRRLREGGSLKIRLPSGSSQAILINTSGGMAGGDAYAVDLEAEAASRLTVTSQAAERVYRSLGPSARFSVRHRVGEGASLFWLPQETILFDGAALHRSVDVDLESDAVFLGLESTILGRRESGETVSSIAFREDWTIRRSGRLLHADRFRIDGAPPRSAATLGQAQAFATLVLVSPDAEARLCALLPLLNETSGASAWNGKLVARLAAADGFLLRKLILRLLPILVPPADLPRLWLL
jgi:urease accessory protein